MDGAIFIEDGIPRIVPGGGEISWDNFTPKEKIFSLNPDAKSSGRLLEAFPSGGRWNNCFLGAIFLRLIQ